jgi:glyoxylase-like metal-dependent hydrolase (beta-lactamase superfamily II)
MHTEETVVAWRTLISGALANRPVTRVISTHMHADHVGMAGWLGRIFDCQLWMSRLEYVTCRSLFSDTGRDAPEDGIRFYRAAGWDDDAIDDYKSRFGGYGRGITSLPDSYKRIEDTDELQIGGRVWKAVIGRGHSPEHVCLYCPSLRVFISGDQVLPNISSNVSVFPTEPAADPLSDWLESLSALQTRVPDDALVLPAHNTPFVGLHKRLQDLTLSHRDSLVRLSDVLRNPKRAVDVFPALFHRPIDSTLLGLATGESLAHLNYLIGQDRVVKERDSLGVAWYRNI